MLGFAEDIEGGLLSENMPDERPVDQVFGVKNGQTRYTVETRRRHIEIVADADHIRVGIISVKDRILIRAVAIVGHPDFRYLILPIIHLRLKLL